MTDKELWRRMENLSLEEQSPERDRGFMFLLKTAYDKDMSMIIACMHDPFMQGMARQAIMDVMGKQMLVCYTNKWRAKTAKHNMTWDVVGARDLMNNMFNKDILMGLIFNPNDENMLVIQKDLLLSIMPGDKPKPEFFRE